MVRLGRLLIFFGSLISVSLSLGAIEPAYFRAPSGQSIPVVPNQVLVRFKPASSPAAKAGVLQSLGVKPQSQIAKIGVDVLPVPASETLESFIESLKKNPHVEFAEPNRLRQALSFDSPNDPKYQNIAGLSSSEYQYYLLNNLSTQNGVINIKEAWGVTTGNDSVVVAVLDTGVLQNHLDIASKLTATRARMENDLNGDGDCTDIYDECASSNPEDNSSGKHGTRVAGIIGAHTDNGIAIAGVAPQCKIMPIKVITSVGFGTEAAIANGIIFAVDNGAKVINMSLGGPSGSAAEEAAVQYAVQNDVVVVAAAGNCGSMVGCPCGEIMYPAAYDGVIAVGATDDSDLPASFSCTGPQLDVVAPGVGILSIASLPDGTGAEDGTSFAAPIVAGVAALIRSLDPTLPARDVIRYINFNADDLGSAHFDRTYGFGRLNAGKAVKAAQAKAPFISNPAEPGETFPYPNPFNPTLGTPVTIAVPESLGGENIKIEIFNLLGHHIKTITGATTWDGRNEDGNFVASGLYIYYLKTSQGSKRGKLTVLK